LDFASLWLPSLAAYLKILSLPGLAWIPAFVTPMGQGALPIAISMYRSFAVDEQKIFILENDFASKTRISGGTTGPTDTQDVHRFQNQYYLQLGRMKKIIKNIR
jgi:hypothetical protein